MINTNLWFVMEIIADVNIKQDDFQIASRNCNHMFIPIKQNFGIVKENQKGAVISFDEKLRYPGSINIGYFIFDKKIFKHIQTANNWLDLIKILIQKKQLYAFKHDGIHITINTLTELASAEKSIELYLNKL